MPQDQPTKFDFDIGDFKGPTKTPETNIETTPGVEHTNLDEIQTDLADFQQRTNELRKKPSEFDRFLDKLEQNPTPENISRLRQANQTLEQNAENPIEKHARLAAKFTKEVKVRIDGKTQPAFKIDFTGRSTAEGNVGLGDVMPPRLETVAVYNEKGELITDKAVRRINGKNRIGYYDVDSGSYIPIFHNYYAVPKGTRSNKKDMTLSLRKVKEEVALFNQPQDTSREEEQDDLDTLPKIIQPKTAKIGDIKLAKKSPEKFEQQYTKNSKFGSTRKELYKMGYKGVRRVSPAVTKKAHEILPQRNKIGTTTIIEIDGKKYAFRDEVHCHKQTDNVPAHLKRPHHGVSVLEYRGS